MSDNCIICSTKVIAKDNVSCSVCKRFFHIQCVHITASDLAFLKDEKKGWKCPACLNAGRSTRSNSVNSTSSDSNVATINCPGKEDLLSAVDPVSRKLDLLLREFADIKRMQTSIVDDIAQIKLSQTVLNDKYNDLSGSISKCKAKIHEHDDVLGTYAVSIEEINGNIATIENTLSALSANVAENDSRLSRPRPGDVSVADDIIAEISERQKRSKNVMLYGVQENQVLPVVERNRVDAQAVESLFAFLLDNKAVSILSIRRVGRMTAGRVRPLKIALSSDGDVGALLSNASKLKTSGGYKDVFMSIDRTPKQQEAYRAVKKELQARIQNGENNLTIRYVKGTPTIVKVNQ